MISRRSARAAAGRAARSAGEAYRRALWRGFDLGLSAWRALRPAPPAPTRPERVLQVSPLSHKPWMLSRLLRDRGVASAFQAIEAEHTSGLLDLGYDHNIPARLRWLGVRPFIELASVLRILRDYDVVHYHFATFIGPGGSELKHLRAANKAIVVHFRGCDLRQGSINKRLHPELNLCQECDYPVGTCETERQYAGIDLARRFADAVFVTTPDLLDFMPEAEHVPFLEPDPAILARVSPAPRDPEVFRVVTSTNHEGLDGTRYVREAVARLAREGERIELVEVRDTPWLEALALYRSADVYVGKLRMGYYNNSHLECLALGVPCMAHVRADLLRAAPDCPIIDVRPDTVYARLREYLHRRDELRELGRRGPGFVRAHHGADVVAARLLDRYRRALRRKRSLPLAPAPTGQPA